MRVQLSPTSTALALTPLGWQPATPPAEVPAEPIWVDHLLTDHRQAEAILAAEWLRGAFPQMEVSRAARGGSLPPTDPPRIRTFADWAFGRVYWLGSKYEAGKPILLTQEVHILAGHSLVMTLRYPVMNWQQVGEGDQRLELDGDHGLDVGKVLQHALVVREMCSTPSPHFGSLLTTTLLGRITSSYIQALDLIGVAADELETRVSGAERVDVGEEALRLRKALRQVRWAFLPADESSELLTWPRVDGRDASLDARLQDVGAESDRTLATTRDLMEQVQQTFDLEVALRQEAIERATFSLTVVAALVLPPSLIAGIYGMNFGAHILADGKVALLTMLASMAASWMLLHRIDPRRGRKTRKTSS